MNAIEVSGLAKKYVIGQKAHMNSNLREVIEHRFRNLFPRTTEQKQINDFWALDDLSFTIKEGERVGIIGRNGAGKSTLLKVLSRITIPTKGRVSIRGNIASLLEVGTGFHPDLTGRENIFLNGAILGMSRQEIIRKFDEIVHFAEIDKFLDTPVKRYSSGMYVRLAFAVASCLDSDILVVDEVLAVGDMQFQKKCLGKMEEVGKSGRTVLLVSHNMDAIQKIATSVLYLDKGKLLFQGGLKEGIARYVENRGVRTFKASFAEAQGLDRYGKRDAAELLSLESLDSDGKFADTFDFGSTIKFRLGFELKREFTNPELGICINNSKGARLHHVVSHWHTDLGTLSPGHHHAEITVPNVKLYPGSYTVTTWIRSLKTQQSDDFIEDALSFEICSTVDTREINFTDFAQTGGVWIGADWEVLN